MDRMPDTFDKSGFDRATSLGPIISDTYVKFKFPVSVPDILLVGATIKPGYILLPKWIWFTNSKLFAGDLAENRYILTHNMWSLRHQRIVAEGYATVLCYDYKEKKPKNIPPEMKMALDSMLETDSLLLEEIILNTKEFDSGF